MRTTGSVRNKTLLLRSFHLAFDIRSPIDLVHHLAKCCGYAENRIINRVGEIFKSIAMKKLMFLISVCLTGFFSFSQRPNAPVDYLVSNNDFINWISNVASNEWDIQVDFNSQLGNKINEFRKALNSTQTNEDVNKVISTYGLDPEFSDQKMAEHIAFGLYLKQDNPWLWDLGENDRVDIIRRAYFQGMSSNDPRWVSVKSNLLGKVQLHSGATGRITAAEIADCFWDMIKDAISIVGGFTAVVNAINQGNWPATVAAIKKVLKSMGRKLGWFGLAIAAIDIGVCIWNANDE